MFIPARRMCTSGNIQTDIVSSVSDRDKIMTKWCLHGYLLYGLHQSNTQQQKQSADLHQDPCHDPSEVPQKAAYLPLMTLCLIDTSIFRYSVLFTRVAPSMRRRRERAARYSKEYMMEQSVYTITWVRLAGTSVECLLQTTDVGKVVRQTVVNQLGGLNCSYWLPWWC